MRRVKNKRIALWAHLVSAHATVIDLDVPYADLKADHDHEHKGPGTIRNHHPDARDYSLKKLGEVLAESED